MTNEQKALEVLRVMAQVAADGGSLTVAPDWGFGSATVIHSSGVHTHIGVDTYADEKRNFESFIDGLYALLINQSGLSWAGPSNDRAQPPRASAASEAVG